MTFSIKKHMNSENFQTWANVVTIITLIPVLITIIFQYFIPGNIAITMPSEVGLGLNPSTRFYIYVTFSNDGSPNRVTIIRSINATGWIHREGKPDEDPIKFDWIYVERFVSLQDYEHNYKRPKETIPTDSDFATVFESYKAPFSISGGQTVSKLLEFRSSKMLNLSENFTFKVEIEATTQGGKRVIKSPTISYNGSGSTAVRITTQPNYIDWRLRAQS